MSDDVVAEGYAAEDATEAGGRQRLLLAGGLAAAVLLAGGGYLLLSAGGSEDETFLVPRHKAAPKVTASAKPAAPAVVPVLSKTRIGRDPFKPLYVVPAAPVAPEVRPPTSGGSTDTPDTPTAAPAEEQHKLVLSGVSGSGAEQTASFNVDGRLMVAKVGSVFGPTSELKLLSLAQSPKGVWTATLQVGDSQPFDVAKGETVYVR